MLCTDTKYTLPANRRICIGRRKGIFSPFFRANSPRNYRSNRALYIGKIPIPTRDRYFQTAVINTAKVRRRVPQTPSRKISLPCRLLLPGPYSLPRVAITPIDLVGFHTRSFRRRSREFAISLATRDAMSRIRPRATGRIFGTDGPRHEDPQVTR